MKRHPEDPDMLLEYDSRGAIRGKYAARYEAGSNVVVLDNDVARVFPNAEAVNRALRAVAQILADNPRPRSPRKRTEKT